MLFNNEIGLNKVVSVKKEGDNKFVIEFLLNVNYNIEKYSIIINNDIVSVTGNLKKLNDSFLEILKKSFSTVSGIDIDSAELIGENPNKSNLIFTALNKKISPVISWEYTSLLNPIEIPYSNGQKITNYFDPKTLLLLSELSKLSVLTDTNISFINLSMIIEGLIMNRILHMYFLIQNIYILDKSMLDKNTNMFKKESLEFNFELNKKEITCLIKSELDLSLKLNLNIDISIGEKSFKLTSIDNEISVEAIKKIVEFIFEEKIYMKNILSRHESASLIKNRFIFDSEKKSLDINGIFIYEPLNDMYSCGYGYYINIYNMDMEEVFESSELLVKIKSKILNIFS